MLDLEKTIPEVQTGRPIRGIDFRREHATMVLDIDGQNLAEGLLDEEKYAELAEHGFRLTDRPHITVLNYGSGSSILKQIEQFSQVGQSIILRDIEKIASRQDWSWQPTGELHPFMGQGRSTLKVIANIDCPGVAQFYNEVEEFLPGVQIERHPMHITLLKKPVSTRDLIESNIAELDFSRPLMGLGHLALGYEFTSTHSASPNPTPLISPNARDAFLSSFRIEPSDRADFEGQESKLINGINELAFPLSSEIVEKAKQDFHYLDIIGAAAVGRRIALVPEALEHLMPGAGIPKITPDHSPLEKANFFDEEMEKALEALQAPQVVANRIIAGAIVRMAQLFNNQRLTEEAGRRIAEDPMIISVRLKSVGAFRQISDELLKALEPKETPIVDDNTQSLQTGVDQVELAA